MKERSGGSGVVNRDANALREGSGVFARRATAGLDGMRVGGRVKGPADGIGGRTGGEGVFGREVGTTPDVVCDGPTDAVAAAASFVCKFCTLRVRFSTLLLSLFFSFKALY